MKPLNTFPINSQGVFQLNGRGPQTSNWYHGLDSRKSAHAHGGRSVWEDHKEVPGPDKLIAASIQWAEMIMQKIDERFAAK